MKRSTLLSVVLGVALVGSHGYAGGVKGLSIKPKKRTKSGSSFKAGKAFSDSVKKATGRIGTTVNSVNTGKFKAKPKTSLTLGLGNTSSSKHKSPTFKLGNTEGKKSTLGLGRNAKKTPTLSMGGKKRTTTKASTTSNKTSFKKFVQKQIEVAKTVAKGQAKTNAKLESTIATQALQNRDMQAETYNNAMGVAKSLGLKGSDAELAAESFQKQINEYVASELSKRSASDSVPSKKDVQALAKEAGDFMKDAYAATKGIFGGKARADFVANAMRVAALNGPESLAKLTANIKALAKKKTGSANALAGLKLGHQLLLKNHAMAVANHSGKSGKEIFQIARAQTAKDLRAIGHAKKLSQEEAEQLVKCLA